jgi:hypothetical protein
MRSLARTGNPVIKLHHRCAGREGRSVYGTFCQAPQCASKRGPNEFDNVYSDASQAGARADMYRRLSDWSIASQDPMRAPVEDPSK